MDETKNFDDYTAMDTALFKRTSIRGSVAIFLYSRNVYADCTIKHYDENDNAVRAIARSGITYVPVSFFSNFLGAELTENGDTATLTKGENKVQITLGKKEFTANGKTECFAFVPETVTGHLYVPAIRLSKLLGVPAKSYNEDLLTIFGEDGVRTLDENPGAVYAGGYLVLGDYDKALLTKENMRIVKDKWRVRLVGNQETNDCSNSIVSDKLKDVSRNCKNKWESLHREADRYCLFGDKHPKDSVDLATQYNGVYTLARGYATYGNDFYHNEDLKKDILDCLEWMYENMYGENEINERGWRSPRDYDWWHWYVGGAIPLLDTLMLLEDQLTKEDINKYLRCFKYTLTLHRVGFYSNFAMSRIIVCSRAGLLLEDPDMIYTEAKDYDLLLSIKKYGEGTHIDYVDWSHGFPYNVFYGQGNLERTLGVGSIFGGTPLEFISPRQYRLFNLVKYMFEAACYQGRAFCGYTGRAISGKEINNGLSIAIALLPMLGLYGEDEDKYIKKMIKRYCAIPEYKEQLMRRCSFYFLSQLMDILNDDTISDANDFELTYAWFTGDRVAQHKDNYAFLLCMTSSRHPNYESIDEANRKGWYTCDGSLYLYTDADYHSFDGAHFIANDRIAYRIPGTTVDEQTRTPWAYRSGWRPSTDFAGCMQIDKKYAVGAFDYESYNYAGHENENTTDGGYGGGFIYHENDLRAKKAYFFFNKECVCLGAGIHSTMNSPVNTTVEHRRLVKDNKTAFGLENIVIDGDIMPKEEFSEHKSGAKWASLEGVGSYVFLENSDVYYNRYNVHGEMKVEDMYFIPDPADKKYETSGKPYFELGIAHGANPTDASYAYAVLPYLYDASEYAKSPEIEIISNTKSLQAVRKPSCGITFYVFHENGSCEGITASDPCIVAVKENGEEYTISVCDPTQKLTAATLTISRALTLADKSRQLEVHEGEETEITVDFTDSVGENFTARFKK